MVVSAVVVEKTFGVSQPLGISSFVCMHDAYLCLDPQCGVLDILSLRIIAKCVRGEVQGCDSPNQR